MSSSRNTNYLSILSSQSKKIFSVPEIALLWGISNQKTLHTTLYRYKKRQVLYRLATGFYSLVPINKLHPFEIGCSLSGPLSYVSSESILSKEGWINQIPDKITLFGKKRKTFQIGDHSFLCRYLKPSYLVNRFGIIQKAGYSIANPIRALADLKNVNPHFHPDSLALIDPISLTETQRMVGYL